MMSDELGQILGNSAVTEYLSALTDRSTAILGAGFVGAYAAGSLALDNYEQGRSDVDIAIVCSAPLERPIKEQLVAALRHEELPCPARGLELVVYTAAVAGAGTADPGFEVELNTGSRMDFRATYAAADRSVPDGLFWYAIDRSILAESGRALAGPPAAQVFGAVPETVLLELLITSLRWHLGPAEADDAHPGPAADEPAEAASWTDDAVLNACRALRRAQTGSWLGKTAAGRQVAHGDGDGQQSNSPKTPAGVANFSAIVRQALAARHGGAPPSVADARAFQREVLAELQRLERAANPDGRRSAGGR